MYKTFVTLSTIANGVRVEGKGDVVNFAPFYFLLMGGMLLTSHVCM